jgi:hypothetical protein
MEKRVVFLSANDNADMAIAGNLIMPYEVSGTSVKGVGVRINHNLSATQSTYEVTQNVFRQGKYQVYASNWTGKGMNIYSNHFWIGLPVSGTGDVRKAGLWLQNFSGGNNETNIYDNIFDGEDATAGGIGYSGVAANNTDAQTRGVWLDDGRDAQVYCNSMKDLGYAVEALGDNSGSRIRTNVLEEVLVGILSRGRTSTNTGKIDDVGSISFSNANNFANVGTPTGFGGGVSHLASVNWGNIGAGGGAASLYYRSGTSDEPLSGFSTYADGTSQQITPLITSAGFISDSLCDYSGAGGFDSIYSEYLGSSYAARMMMEEQAIDQMLMQEEAEVDDEMGVKLFEAQQQMYLSLDTNPSLLSSSSLLYNYYHDLEISDAGIAARINDLKTELAKEEIQAEESEVVSIQQQALWENAGMNTGSDFLINERIVNEIYLQTLAIGADTFSQSQRESIDAIAPLCPYVYGKAVFEARMMQALYKPEMIYNDEVNCASTQSKKEKKTVRQQEWKVMPNPAKDWTWIIHPEIQNAKVEVISMNGMLQNMHGISNGRKTMVSLNGLSSGVYLIRVVQDGRVVFTDKIIVNL